MKYVITDKGEARVEPNFMLHMDIAIGLEGHVVAAGHCRRGVDGRWYVYGESFGFGIKAKPEDADILNQQIPV